MSVYDLEVYTWAGTSFWAVHYYAELRDPNGKHLGNDVGTLGRIVRPLSEANAASINKRLWHEYNEDRYSLYKVSTGDMDDRFDTKEEATGEAIKLFLSVAEPGDVLVDREDRKRVIAIKEKQNG